jgi:hypothetical protein
MLSPGVSFILSWLIDENLVPLLDKFFRAGWRAGQRSLVVRVDNAPAHNSKMTRDFLEHNPLQRLQHPPYSRNTSSSDFCLFGKVKGADRTGDSHEIGLLEAVTEIVNDISNAELQRVFRCWIEFVQKAIDPEGDYSSKSMF